MSFYNDLEKSLLEAIEMERGEVVLQERTGMPGTTFFVEETEKFATEGNFKLKNELKE